MPASAHQIQIHITRILRASFHQYPVFTFKVLPRPFRIIAEQEKTGAGYQPLHPRKSFFIISFRADLRIKAAMAFIQVIAPPDMDTDRLTVLYLFLQPEIILRQRKSTRLYPAEPVCFTDFFLTVPEVFVTLKTPFQQYRILSITSGSKLISRSR